MILARYEVLETVGAGTWRVRDTETGDLHALKRLSLAGVPQVDSLVEQAKARLQLSVDGTPKLLDLRVFEFEGRTEAFLVREWIEGESLADRLADRGRLSPGLARHVGVAILDILDRLHATGQVHGDVQPANVLLSPDGMDVTLVDAAPLKVAARSGISAGWNISVADGYCAPEVLITGATPGSDQYSTGRTLLHALGGRPPDEVDEELLRSPEFDVDTDLIDGILQLCSPVTMSRFPSAHEAAEALAGEAEVSPQDVVDNDLVLAPSDEHRRQRMAVSALWGALILATMGLAAFLFVPRAPELLQLSLHGAKMGSIAVVGGSAMLIAVLLGRLDQRLGVTLDFTDRRLSAKTDDGWVRAEWDGIRSVEIRGRTLTIEADWAHDDIMRDAASRLHVSDGYDIPLRHIRRLLNERLQEPEEDEGSDIVLLDPHHGVEGAPAASSFLPNLRDVLRLSRTAIPVLTAVGLLWYGGSLAAAGSLSSGGDEVEKETERVAGVWERSDGPRGAGERKRTDRRSDRGASSDDHAAPPVEVEPPQLVVRDTCPAGMMPGTVAGGGTELLTCDNRFGTMVTVPGVAGTSREPFLVDRIEVPVGSYNWCVEDGTCDAVELDTGGDGPRRWDTLGGATLEQAIAYCTWSEKDVCSGAAYDAMQPPRGLDSSDWPTVVLNTVGNQAEWESGGDLRLDRGVESRPTDAQVGFRCCLDF